MMRVTRASDNESILFVGIKPGFPLPENEEVWFQRECASPMECRLLCEMLQRKQGEQLSLLRKASYFRGWKHAKAKKGGKRIWFPTAFELLPWEKVEAGL